MGLFGGKLAEKCGNMRKLAVNCVHNNKGYNTDWMGFIHALNQNQIEVKDKSCLIIGSGGAAYAIAYALIKCEVSSISIKNRYTRDK